MPKKPKKSSKGSDQGELPLDAAAETPAADGKGRKPDANGTPGEGGKSDKTLAVRVPDPVSIETPPPPPRKKGQKVQDEPAPLAQHYRNWFLEYASYVILDRAVPHLNDGL